MSSIPIREPVLSLWLFWAAIAAVVRGGLGGAALALELQRGVAEGCTGPKLLGLLGFLPALVLLVATVQLADHIGSTALSRSATWAFVVFWLPEPLRLFRLGGLSVGWAATIGIILVVTAVAALGLSVWYDVTLIRLRKQLGGMSAVLGWCGLLYTAAWLIMRVLLITGFATVGGGNSEEADQALVRLASLEQIDILLILTARTLLALVGFCFFLGLREQRIEPARA